MELSKKKLRTLRRVLAFTMLGLAIYTTVELTADWVNEGRKEGKAIDVIDLEGVYPPSVYFKPEAAECGIVTYGCSFNINNTQTDCSDAMEEYGGLYCRLLNLSDGCKPRQYCLERAVNGTYLPIRDICIKVYTRSYIGFNNKFASDNGLVMRNSVDSLIIYFFMNEAECATPEFTKSAQAILMFAERTYNKDGMLRALTNGEDAVTAPIPIGIGHVAYINYNIEQEEFINGTVINTTELQTTQYRRISPPNTSFENYMVSLDFKVSRFTAVRTIHTPGQTWIDLFGGIFGWWGVLTGACILTFFDTMSSVLRKIRKHNKKEFKGSDQTQVDPENGIGTEMPLLDDEPTTFMKPTFAISVNDSKNISTTTV